MRYYPVILPRRDDTIQQMFMTIGFVAFFSVILSSKGDRKSSQWA